MPPDNFILALSPLVCCLKYLNTLEAAGYGGSEAPRSLASSCYNTAQRRWRRPNAASRVSGRFSLIAVILKIPNCWLWWDATRPGFTSGTQFVRNTPFQSLVFPQKSKALYWNQMCCVHSESKVTFWNSALFIAPAYIHVAGLWWLL